MAIDLKVRCSRQLHKIHLDDNGQLCLVNHTKQEIEGMQAMEALGAGKARCLQILELWRAPGRTEQLGELPVVLQNTYRAIKAYPEAQRLAKKLIRRRGQPFMRGEIQNYPKGSSTYDAISTFAKAHISKEMKARGYDFEFPANQSYWDRTARLNGKDFQYNRIANEICGDSHTPTKFRCKDICDAIECAMVDDMLTRMRERGVKAVAEDLRKRRILVEKQLLTVFTEGSPCRAVISHLHSDPMLNFTGEAMCLTSYGLAELSLKFWKIFDDLVRRGHVKG